MSKISWLHLSDLHFGRPHRKIYYDGLIDDIKKVKNETG